MSNIDQKGSVVPRKDEEVELILVIAVSQQRRRRAPSGDIWIEIEQAGKIPRLLRSKQGGTIALDGRQRGICW
ncbi:hypothetical protein [Sinorhizobium sp. NFACC03]|uniref:hypothetical protein n=1 Tax=Sinorhizobium sp. NFACC03 TaxID=1566295 RepID=UPI0015A2CA00|nr:hypothetical protein [Sinorhizobium sp. NFACC03]